MDKLSKLPENDLEALKKVEQISELMKQMNSSDSAEANLAMEKLNAMLKLSENSEVDKTLINKGWPLGSHQKDTMGVEAFKEAFAADAEERHKRRAKMMVRAEKLKGEANEFFRAGDWTKAINLYTQAIETVKDWSILYTNRAQAFMRCGKPEKALADCDVALRLLPTEPIRTPTNIGEEAEKARKENQAAAKACLHRGKALLFLRRPRDALQAYSDSRAFKICSENPAVNAQCSNDTPDQWPSFLREYVAQAQAAIAAENVDSQAEELMHMRIGNMEPEESTYYFLKPSEENFLRLIAEAAFCGHLPEQYTSILCQMAKILSAAAVTTGANEPTIIEEVQKGDKPDGPQQLGKYEGVVPALGSNETSSGSRRRRRRKPANKQKRVSVDEKHSGNGPPKEIVEQTPEGELASLQQLQSFFRVKNGFKVLAKQMELLDTLGNVKMFYAPSSDQTPVSSDECLRFLDHLLALVTVCYQLCRDSGENQRLLVESMPKLFGQTLVECLELSPATIQLPSSTKSASVTPGDLDVEIRHRHTLDLLRYSACELLVLMSSEASGREGLLSAPGPARLLTALAVCLSDALGLPKPMPSKTFNGLQLQPEPLPVSHNSAFAMQTVAAIAHILENLTASDHFLSLVRSTDCFTALQDVVEAAVAVPSSSSASSSVTAAPALCLSLLLDSLSVACHDVGLRRRLVSKPKFILNLANCLLRHAPLISDENHVALVGSLCRTLHNCLTGEDAVIPSSVELGVLLSGVGTVLDQPSRNHIVLSVVIVLLGKIMPMCTATQIEKWCREGNPIVVRQKSTEMAIQYPREYSERVNILLAIIKSFNVTVLHEASKPSVDASGKAYESEESLSAHRLRGSIRALAAITKADGCKDIRYGIGDNRLITRRLAGLVRTRDDPLAANVCIILQQCIEDTPMAEHLQGTSIIIDLLKLIEDSSRLETKRNAAVVAAKLASSSQVHRDVLSQLDGINILSRFNAWTAALGK